MGNKYFKGPSTGFNIVGAHASTNLRALFGCVLVSIAASVLCSDIVSANPIQSTNIVHTKAYLVHTERGPHVAIIITPPSARGVDGRVLIEVYNRTKVHLALVKFDINLRNSGGFSINSTAEAKDLKAKSSSAIWIKLPKIKEQFPQVTAATADGLRVINANAIEIPVKAYLTVITK